MTTGDENGSMPALDEHVSSADGARPIPDAIASSTEIAHYTSFAKLLHWLIAGLIVLQYVLANLADQAGDDGALLQELILLANHKSVGVTVLVLVLVRIAWRILNPAPSLPAATPRWQAMASKLTHGVLYALILAMPISGWLISDTSNYAASWFNLFVLPDFLAADPERQEIFEDVHEILAKLLIVVAGLHVLAALKHALVDRDGVLARMSSTPAVSSFVLVVIIGVACLGSLGSCSAFAAEAAEDESAQQGSPVTDWQIDYEDSYIRFTGEQAGASFDGEWTDWSAEIRFDVDELGASRFDVSIRTAVVSTGDGERDEVLGDPEWFDSGAFPTATYQTSGFSEPEAGQYSTNGMLKIKDTTLPVTLHFTVVESGTSRLLEGTAEIDRLAFSVGTGEWTDTDWVGQFVEVTVRVSGVVDAN